VVEQLLEAAAAVRSGRVTVAPVGPLRVGVDLGTATCVLVVLDGGVDARSADAPRGVDARSADAPRDEPVWVDSHPSAALRDGVVVDFARAVATVRLLRERAQEALGVELTAAATAHPPCIPAEDARACTYVCEAAGFTEVVLVDEVSAAQRTIEVRDGVIVDVGGGSTGVGVFRSGRLAALDDRAGGGHHLDLVLAGALGIPLEEAEVRKREHPEEALPILVPGLQRIGESVRAMTRDAADLPLHLAGGALMIPGAGQVLASYLGRRVVTYPHALLITPVGIARSVP
jgi:ethanolamine utilization protein EutJ